MLHLGKNTTSRIISKGIAAGKSNNTYRGLVSAHRKKEVLGVLGKRIGKQTLLIVEHKISQVEDFLERLTVMHEGRIIADGACEECLRDPEVRRSYWQIETPADGIDDPRTHGVHGDE